MCREGQRPRGFLLGKGRLCRCESRLELGKEEGARMFDATTLFTWETLFPIRKHSAAPSASNHRAGRNSVVSSIFTGTIAGHDADCTCLQCFPTSYQSTAGCESCILSSQLRITFPLAGFATISAELELHTNTRHSKITSCSGYHLGAAVHPL